MPEQSLAPRPWSLIRTFAGLFLAFSVLLAGIAAVHYYTHYQSARVTREASEEVSVALMRKAVLSDIASVVTDLMVLARQAEAMLGADREAPDRMQLARTFAIFVSQKRFYDQIRFIDASGRESVRINYAEGEPSEVAVSALQDKSSRYYFAETMSLGPGGIYISPLDLNVEQGEIERPFKPMMRFATPVVDQLGGRRGILVLNYLGQRMLDNFTEAALQVVNQIQLVDNAGYWLSAPSPGDAWGFMLGHRRTFARRYPEEWKRILDGAEGQFISPRGLFTFTTVSPVKAAEEASHSGFDVVSRAAGLGGQGYYWKIVSHVSARHLAGIPAQFMAQHSVLYLALLALIALGSWMLARARLYHRLAEAQSEYERRFRHTLEDIELAAVTVDRRGRLTFCNRYFLALTGWPSEQVVGKDWVQRFVPAEQHGLVRGALERMGEPVAFPKRFETEIRTRSGDRRLIAWHNSLSLDLLGSAQSFTAIGEDITEKRRVERELLKLHRAVEQSSSIVVITDKAGNVEYVNPKFTAVTGYRSDEVIGLNPSLLKSGETNPEEYGRLWHTISNGGVWYGEFHNRRKNGELYWESAAISAVRDSHGAITHYLAVKEDITERKRLEQEVEARNRELARAQALAQMGRMASMIAHDLRNPLSSVKVTLQVFDKRWRGVDADTSELLRIALDQVAYMEAILNDMLSYSRPQALRAEWLDPVRLMETAIGLARRKIQEAGVQVETRYQPGMPTFPGDPHQLRQVLSNLLINAVQAMEGLPADRRRLDVSVDLDMSAAGTAVLFRVCDSGCGLGDEDPEHLFEPFYTTRAQGTGLGLAIVRRILEEHRGSVALQPRQPYGASAVVSLPLVPAGAQ